VIYQENFDGADPGWTTNDPGNMYWDQPNGRYHVMSWGGSNTYAYVPVSIPAGVPYRLEFDAYVTRLDSIADMRVSMGDADMNVNQPSQWFASYADIGAIGAWVHIDSGAPGGTIYHGYQGPASLNTWYSNVVDCDVLTGTMVWTMVDVSTAQVVFSHTYTNVGQFTGMDRIYTSSIGDSLGAVGEGYIDNVLLTSQAIPEPASIVLLGAGLALLSRRRPRRSPG
jgi:hypothetical protein